MYDVECEQTYLPIIDRLTMIKKGQVYKLLQGNKYIIYREACRRKHYLLIADSILKTMKKGEKNN